jgi:Na+/H+ antiporter NhaD/arsenite permease-like protein
MHLDAANTGAGSESLALPLWSGAPFVLLLLCIAVLPLATRGWWHSNRHKAYVTAAVAIPTALYLVVLQLTTGLHTLEALADKLLEYVSFIIMLGSLYTVAGGIVLNLGLPAGPLTNLAFLSAGALLANLIGTTGASVLLIRPVLRANSGRRFKVHVPIFFIMVVSNLGGLLTPLGDPPLFLGFKNGVPLSWTLTLWPQWLVVNGLVLCVFFAWDTIAMRRETATASTKHEALPTGVEGSVNFLFMGGILGAVLLEAAITGPGKEAVPAVLMLLVVVLSLLLTPRRLRQANSFTWEPITEVAILFAGIFVTMVPMLLILQENGGKLGINEPWQFFWLTGLTSAFLDNAPTYLAFASLASGKHSVGWLVENNAPVLQAISCGAVFMGALTYIGNGPNFMVKAIAHEAGYAMPAFFGYLAYACGILIPIFGAATLIFFR